MPFIYFFVESKQPPSIVYLLFNMAKALAVLALLQTFATQLHHTLLGRVLIVLGRVSLFYYVVHLLVYKLIGAIVPTTFLPHAGIVRGLLEWGLGLLILVPICARYAQLRRKYPEVLQYF
jgi:peptidoglycan/LPS O-acetylase OafA/YrhL